MADFYKLSLTVDPSGAVRGFREAETAAEKTARAAKEAHQQQTRAIDGAADAIKRLIKVYILWKSYAVARETVELAARYQTLGVTIEQTARRTGMATGTLTQLEKALRSTGISMIESRNSIMRMVEAQIDLTSATKLARIAQDAAVIGNMNSSEAFDSLTYAIQTANTIILRRLGLTVQFDQAYQKEAARLGKNVNALTDEEKTRARVNAVMEKGKLIAGTYEAAMETAGKQQQSMKRYVEDFRVELGKTFLPIYTKAIFEMADAFKWAQHHVRELVSAVAAAGAMLGSLWAILKIGSVVAFASSAGVSGLAAAFGTLMATLLPALAPLLAIGAALGAIGVLVYDHMSDVQIAAQEQREWNETLEHLGSKSLQRNIEQTTGKITKLREEIAKAKEQRRQLSPYELQAGLGALPQHGAQTPELNAQLADEERKLKAYQKALEGARIRERNGGGHGKGKGEVSDDIKEALKNAREELAGLERIKAGRSTEEIERIRKESQGNAELAGVLEKVAAVKKEIAKQEKVLADIPEIMDKAIAAQKAYNDELDKQNVIAKARVKAQHDYVTSVEQELLDDVSRAQLAKMTGDAYWDLYESLEFQARSKEVWDTKELARLKQIVHEIVKRKRLESEGTPVGDDPETRRQLAQPWENALRDIQAAFSGFFRSIFTDGISSFKSLAAQIRQLMLSLVSQLAALRVGKIIADKLGDIFGSTKPGPDGKAIPKTGSDYLKDVLGSKWGKMAGGAVAGAAAGYGVGLSLYSPAHGMAGNYARGALGGAAAGAMAGSIFGPPGAIIGAITGAIAGLFGVGSAAKAAAKEMKNLQKALAITMEGLRAKVSGNSLAYDIAQVNAEREQMRQQIEKAYQGGGSNSDTVKKRNQLLMEMNKLEDERIRQLKEEAAITLQRTNEDLKVRLLVAQGRDRDAAALRFQLEQQREMQDAIRNHADPATLALLRQVQAQEALAFATNQASTSALNMVAGYRIQAAVFAAMTPRQTGSVVAGGGFTPATPPVPTFGGSPATGGAAAHDSITVIIPLDGKVIAQTTLKNLKQQAQQTKGDTTKWSEL